MCPNNEFDDKRTPEQFITDTTEGLAQYGDLFLDAKVTGLIEPLGFYECSLRSKKIAVDCISKSGYSTVYALVHDTFHHFLGTDTGFSTEKTALVHISGVNNQVLDIKDFRDPQRILVTIGDRIDNKHQIAELEKDGYKGWYSYEPFSKEVQDMPLENLSITIKNSMEFINN